MIRPFTCVCMLLAGGAGLYLYQAKHQAQLLDREIARTLKQIDATHERASVLSAEYALLNEPQRLADLADRHLSSLKTTAPTQFTTWAEFEKRLPPVGAPAVEAPPLETEVPVATLPEPRPEPESRPDSKPEAKPDVARPVAARPPLVATATSASPVAAAATAFRPVPPAPAPRPAARPAATPVSLTASLQSPSAPPRSPPPHPLLASAPPVHPAAPPQPPAPPLPHASPANPPSGGTGAGSTSGAGDPVTRIARIAPASPTVPAVASSLGMARSMAMAPSPVTRASAPAIWQPSGNPP